MGVNLTKFMAIASIRLKFIMIILVLLWVITHEIHNGDTKESEVYDDIYREIFIIQIYTYLMPRIFLSKKVWECTPGLPNARPLYNCMGFQLQCMD